MNRLSKILFILKHRKYFRQLFHVFRYDFRRWAMFERDGLGKDKDGRATLSRMIECEHSIERSFSLPDVRLGFGRKRIIYLMELVEGYETRFPDNHPVEIPPTIAVIAEYWEFHKGKGYVFEPAFAERMQKFLEAHPATPSHQAEFTPARYWADSHAPFDVFCKSRHSVRAFKAGERVPSARIQEAVRLAHETAPSACNRRQTRIHIVEDPKLVAEICKLQTGNTGFGHAIDKLIIITGLVSYEMVYERGDIYTNCGILAMNLCYALQFHHIAHCCLNWSVAPERDMLLRGLLGIPEEEAIALMLAVGVEKDEFRVTLSPKRPYGEVVTIH